MADIPHNINEKHVDGTSEAVEESASSITNTTTTDTTTTTSSVVADAPVKSFYDKYLEKYEQKFKDPEFIKRIQSKKKDEVDEGDDPSFNGKRKRGRGRPRKDEVEDFDFYSESDDEDAHSNNDNIESEREDEDEEEIESARRVADDASKYDDFKKQEEDGEFDEISSHTVKKMKKVVKETGVRRSRRATKRVKYVDDYDSDEFNDDSSEDEKAPAKTVKKVNTYAPTKKVPGRGRGRPKGSLNKKGTKAKPNPNFGRRKISSRRQWELEDEQDPRPKIEKYLGRRLNDLGEVEYLLKFLNLSYLHCKWMTYEQIVRDCNVAVRHIGMLTIFDKLVDKEGEEKWSGEIDKDLITIDKIIAEKQVLKEIVEEKPQREGSFEEGKNIKIKVKLEKNGNATIINNTNLNLNKTSEGSNVKEESEGGNNMDVGDGDGKKSNVETVNEKEDNDIEKSTFIETTFRGARLGLILTETRIADGKVVTCSAIDTEFQNIIDTDSHERIKIKPGDIIRQVGDVKMDGKFTSIGKVVNQVKAIGRPLKLIFERKAEGWDKRRRKKAREDAKKGIEDEKKKKKENYETMFLVKWKDRPFKDATWEKEKDINNDLKIGQFRIFQAPPTKSNYKTALQRAKKKAKLKKQKERERRLKLQDLKLPRWIIDVPENVELDTAISLSRIIDELCVIDKLPDGWEIIKGDTYEANGLKYIQNKNDTSTKRPMYYCDTALQNPDEYFSEEEEIDSDEDSAFRVDNDVSDVAATMLRRFVPYKKSPIYKNGLRLRDYQVLGVNWMLKNWYSQRGGILADEMGLGKTCQVVCMLEHIRAVEQIRGPFLIVVPLSTIGHWKREIESWTDMNCCVYYDQGGGEKGREIIRKYEWRYDNNATLKNSRSISKFNILLTTYETCSRDLEYLGTFTFQCMIVDEGHRLKNHKSKLAMQLRFPYIRADYRLLLTGTPIQNNLKELWALLNFVHPRNFKSLDEFLEKFGNIQGAAQVDALRKVMGPYILRRLKHEVETAIPPRQETIIDVELTTLQKQYYRAIFDKNREFLYHGCHGNVPALLNVDMQLRKCCNHPFLIDGVEEREEERIRDAVEHGVTMTQLSKIDDEEALALAQARLAGLLEEEDGGEKKDGDGDPPESTKRYETETTTETILVKKKRAKVDLQYTIEHIDPEFYETYEGDWCRYCGAREASAFNRGPWGSRMLCTTHYVHWFTKKSLTFADYPIAPTQPINPAVNTEFKWKAYLEAKDKKEEDQYEERTITVVHRRKRSNKSGFIEMPGCEVVIRKIADRDIAYAFLEPVNFDQVPSYRKVIRRPMDLSTVWRKLKGLAGEDQHYFGNHKKFARDMRLIFRNCLQFNEEGSEIANHAEALLDEFEELYSVWVEHTSIRNFDAIIKKLPILPVEWIDEHGDKPNKISTEGSSSSSQLANNDKDMTALARLKKRQQKLRSRLHRIDNLNRQIMNHPDVNPTYAQQDEMAKRAEYANELKDTEARLVVMQEEYDENVWRAKLQRMVDCCGKMVFVDKLLPKLRREGHKVLIFSQFKVMLDIMGNYLDGRGYQHERLDGSVHGRERQISIDRFNKDPDIFAFLLSTRAGGVGINLTAADTVIIYDSDWNPQNDLQALARCHRIGQKREVTVYRLITRRSYEAQMFHKASIKLGLERAVMSGTSHGDSSVFTNVDDDGGSALPLLNKKEDAKELERLLREGAFAMMDNKDSKEFTESTIDHILQTRARDVTYKDGEAQGFSSGNNTGTEKMSFTSAEADTNIDVDDPDFWNLVMPGIRSARELRGRLNDGSALASEEKKVEFIGHLRELVDELLQAKQNGDDVSPSEWETCKKIALQVSCMKSSFAEHDVEAAAFWLKSMEGSRSRRATNRLGNNAAKNKKNNDSDSDDDDLWNASKRRKRGRGRPPVVKPPKEKGPKNIKLFQDFCALCQDGGQLLCCDGTCLRAFHAECVGLKELPEGDSWLCPDCTNKQHVCLACGQVGRDADVHTLKGIPDKSVVFLCCSPRCGRYYHLDCLKKMNDVVTWRGREFRSAFTCPQHRCKVCKVKTGNAQLFRCTSCPDAYHRTCVDKKRCLRLNNSSITCQKHFDGTRTFEWDKRKSIHRDKKPRKGRARKQDYTGPVRKSNRANKGPKNGYKELDPSDVDEEESSSEEQSSSEESSSEEESEEEDEPEKKRPKKNGPKPDELDTTKNIWTLTQRSSRTASKEVLKCEFCNGPHSVDGLPGPFLDHPFVMKKENASGKILETAWVHRACADLSPQVFVNDKGEYCKVADEIKRGRKIKCFMPNCKQPGATIGCLVSKCKNSVHVSCAVECGWKFGAGTSAFLCPNHRPIQMEKKRKEAFYKKIREKEEAEEEKKRKREETIAAKKKKLEDERLENERKSKRRSSRARSQPVTYTDVVPQAMIAKNKGKEKKKEIPLPPKEATYCLCHLPVGEDKGSFWLGCETCENWFHPKCVGLPTAFAKRVAKDGDWNCPECAEELGMYGLKAMKVVEPTNASTKNADTSDGFHHSPKKISM